MKKTLKYLFIPGLVILIYFACDKKRSTGITPTYGSTGNPNPGNITVTGSSTYSNPATENTSIYVGGSGWTNPTCGSTKSLTLKGYKGDIDVTLTFASPAITGTYAVALTPGANACAMTIANAPGQPAGIVWHGKRGTISVNQTTASINAAFTNVTCVQKTFDFPVVSASGVLGCSQ